MSRVSPEYGKGFEGRSERRERPSDWIRSASVYQLLTLANFRAEVWLNALGQPTGRLGLNEILPAMADGFTELRDWGYDTFWPTGLYPMGTTNAKGGEMGGRSPYAPSKHIEVDQERFGSLENLRTMIQEIHAQGGRVILDLILNHTSWNHEWLNPDPGNKNFHPEYYMPCVDPGHANCFRVGKHWIQCGGCTEFEEGGRTRLSCFSDVAQLNLAHPKLREELKNTVRTLVQLGVDGFRVDMAAQMHREWYGPRWRLEMREEELQMQLISAAREIRQDVGFIAESHGEISPRELYSLGYDVVYRKADDAAGRGWYEAIKSRDSWEISRAIQTSLNLYGSNSAAPLHFIGNHDLPPPHEVFGNFLEGATMLTSLMPGSFLWLGSTEGGYAPPPQILERIQEHSDRIKQVPFSASVDVRYDANRNQFDRINAFFRIRAEILQDLGRDFTAVELPESDRGQWGWNGIRVFSQKNPSGYIVLANPNSHEDKKVRFRSPHPFGPFDITLPPGGGAIIDARTGQVIFS